MTGAPATHRARRVVGGIILMLVGLPFIAYYGIGAMFVAGAVQQRDPAVGWGDVGFCLLWVLGGIALFATGIVLVARRTKRPLAAPLRGA